MFPSCRQKSIYFSIHSCFSIDLVCSRAIYYIICIWISIFRLFRPAVEHKRSWKIWILCVVSLKVTHNYSKLKWLLFFFFSFCLVSKVTLPDMWWNNWHKSHICEYKSLALTMFNNPEIEINCHKKLTLKKEMCKSLSQLTKVDSTRNTGHYTGNNTP